MINRRAFVGASVFGAAFGIAGIVTMRSDASIRFIGRRNTIVALLDTGSVRVVFLLGEQDDGLLKDFAGLTTIGNSRIDLVIGTHRVLSTTAARKYLQIHLVPTITIQSDLSLPPIRGEIATITHGADLTLGESTSMQLTSTITSRDHPEYLATIESHGARMMLASGNDATRIADGGNYGLVVIPGKPETNALSRVHPQLLVCNTPNLGDVSEKQIQVFPTDPQVVRIGGGIFSVRDDQLSS